MRLMCSERDRLWAEYDALFGVYVRLVMRREARGAAHWQAVQQARKAFQRARRAVELHCWKHGCNVP